MAHKKTSPSKTPTKSKPTAATQRKQAASIVKDRVGYLRSIAAPTVTGFKTAKAAQQSAAEIRKDYGIEYTVKGTKLVRPKVDRQAVQKSREFKRIVTDLKSRSKSAGGKKARALQELGRRETWFNFPVGESTPYQR